LKLPYITSFTVIRFSVPFYTTLVRLLIYNLAILFEWVLIKFGLNKIRVGQIYVMAAVLYRKPRKTVSHMHFNKIRKSKSRKVFLKGI